MIEIEEKGRSEDHAIFNVVVSDSAGRTQHRVTLSDETYQRLTHGAVTPAACVDAAFRFLLEREAKTDILASFDINVIQLYHANFERDIANYL